MKNFKIISRHYRLHLQIKLDISSAANKLYVVFLVIIRSDIKVTQLLWRHRSSKFFKLKAHSRSPKKYKINKHMCMHKNIQERLHNINWVPLFVPTICIHTNLISETLKYILNADDDDHRLNRVIQKIYWDFFYLICSLF